MSQSLRRKQRRKSQRKYKNWLSRLKRNPIAYEWARLDTMQEKYSKGEFRVGECPETREPVLQSKYVPDGMKRKVWHCVHESNVRHKISPGIKVKVFERQEIKM